MKKTFTFIVFAALISFKASAQNDGGISSLFKGNPDDVNKLINAYTTPLFKGFGNGLNGGWTNTAKTQKFLRFAVRLSATVSMVPDAERNYDVNTLGLTNIKATNSSLSIAPTFAGSKDLSTAITVSDPSAPNDPLRKYNTTLPKGVIQYIPAPQLQLTIGLIKNTDVTLRIIPTTQVTADVGSVGMTGVGFKHNIAQDFGTASHLIPFDLSIAVGYTRLSYTKPLSVQPDAGNGGTNGSQDYSNQTLQGDFRGWDAQVIISKKLLFFTPFASVGYLSSTTDVGLKGNFPFVTGVNSLGKPVYTTFADPISITGSATGVSGPRADVGFQMSLFLLKLYASYSFSQYQSANVGIGLGF